MRCRQRHPRVLANERHLCVASQGVSWLVGRAAPAHHGAVVQVSAFPYLLLGSLSPVFSIGGVHLVRALEHRELGVINMHGLQSLRDGALTASSFPLGWRRGCFTASASQAQTLLGSVQVSPSALDREGWYPGDCVRVQLLVRSCTPLCIPLSGWYVLDCVASLGDPVDLLPVPPPPVGVIAEPPRVCVGLRQRA